MSLTKCYLLYVSSKLLLKVDFLRTSYNVSHFILFHLVFWQAKLANVASSPHIEILFLINGCIVITSCFYVDNALSYEITCCYKLWLGVRNIAILA